MFVTSQLAQLRDELQAFGNVDIEARPVEFDASIVDVYVQRDDGEPFVIIFAAGRPQSTILVDGYEFMAVPAEHITSFAVQIISGSFELARENLTPTLTVRVLGTAYSASRGYGGALEPWERERLAGVDQLGVEKHVVLPWVFVLLRVLARVIDPVFPAKFKPLPIQFLSCVAFLAGGAVWSSLLLMGSAEGAFAAVGRWLVCLAGAAFVTCFLLAGFTDRFYALMIRRRRIANVVWLAIVAVAAAAMAAGFS